MPLNSVMYSIFMFVQPIKDWMLACGVALLVVIDVVILTVYSIVEGIKGRLTSSKIPNSENTEDLVGVSVTFVT